MWVLRRISLVERCDVSWRSCTLISYLFLLEVWDSHLNPLLCCCDAEILAFQEDLKMFTYMLLIIIIIAALL